MLTREFSEGSPSNRLKTPALIVSVIFFGLVVFAVLKTHWQIAAAAPQTPTTPGLAEQLFGQTGFVLPLEIAAVLILAVIIGAVVIAREK
jgi:NADH:ubiquinone oxidoreductase subunit 6 (subunit J)